MKPGDAVRVERIENCFVNAQGKMKYKAPKDMVFVAVILGIEPKNLEGSNGKALDLEKAMKAIGWVPVEQRPKSNLILPGGK